MSEEEGAVLGVSAKWANFVRFVAGAGAAVLAAYSLWNTWQQRKINNTPAITISSMVFENVVSGGKGNVYIRFRKDRLCVIKSASVTLFDGSEETIIVQLEHNAPYPSLQNLKVKMSWEAPASLGKLPAQKIVASFVMGDCQDGENPKKPYEFESIVNISAASRGPR